MISCVTFVSVCRWQIYHSLAYGARGILYFYYTPEIHEDDDAGIPTWVGLVRDDGMADHVTEHWHQARRINSVSPSNQAQTTPCAFVRVVLSSSNARRWCLRSAPR